ncbi:serine/threonine-protein kinase [Streptomyces sp. NPDC001315]|uniref:serine/threonine-protein kinase n=1 Tax=Streptomyces sp. NPDC001315 TaxID=3364562 RepID=UPI003679D692
MLGGRYTLAERIGGGAMGDVWRADDTVLERRVAVKILRPELLDDARFAKRFRREALILASLDHPGIVDVHDYGENALGDGSRVAYIVMELVEGRPLDEFLKESGPLPPEQALATTAEALEALHATHRRQVVHRDIKPSNLLICTDGRVKVTDFGLARDLATSKITPEHAVVGTALYIAPEQVEGHGTTPASDLYSMGVVCYRMLTGKLPFDGERAIEILVKHVQQPVPALPADFPQPVRDFVATALAKKPEDRFPDAATMAAAARTAAPAAASGAVADGAVVPPESGGAAEAMVAPQQGRSGRGRRRVLIPLLVACAVTVVVGGVVLVAPSLFRSHTSARGNEASASASISSSTSASGAHGTGASPSASRSPSASPSASATKNGSAEPVGLPPSSPSTSSAAGGSSVVRPSASATMEPSAYPIAGVSMSDDSAAIKGSGVSAGPAGGCTAWLDNAGSGNLYGMLNTSYFETCHAELIRDDGLTVGLAASSGAERTSVISDIGHTMRICVWQQGASADKQCSAIVVIHDGTPTAQ